MSSTRSKSPSSADLVQIINIGNNMYLALSQPFFFIFLFYYLFIIIFFFINTLIQITYTNTAFKFYIVLLC